MKCVILFLFLGNIVCTLPAVSSTDTEVALIPDSPNRGHSLSVFTWPHLWHLMHLTLRTWWIMNRFHFDYMCIKQQNDTMVLLLMITPYYSWTKPIHKGVFNEQKLITMIVFWDFFFLFPVCKTICPKTHCGQHTKYQYQSFSMQ